MDYKKITERQFNKVLEREGQDIIDYYSNETYKVFFRKTSRGESTKENLRLYYPQNTNISKGTIFIFKGENYIIENQDAIESNIYYTSIAVKCVETLSTLYSGNWYNVPIAITDETYDVDKSKTITVVSGDLVCYTQLNEISKTITINESFVRFGGTYKISNFFYNDKLAYLYLTRELNTPDTYELTYTGDTNFNMDDSTTYQLSFNTLKNNEPTSSATLTYTSSDETVATVDANGLLTMLKAGTVNITATWTEQNITKEVSIIISQTTPVLDYVLTFISSGTLYVESTRTLTPTLKDSSGNIVSSWTAVWTVNYGSLSQSDFTITQIGNQLKVSITDNYDLIGEDISFTCTTSDNLATATNTYTIGA